MHQWLKTPSYKIPYELDSHKEQWYSGDKCRLLSGTSLEHFVHVKLSASVILQVLVKSVESF